MPELCHGSPPFQRPCDALTLFGGVADGLTIGQQHIRREALDSILNMNEAPESRMTVGEILATLPGVRKVTVTENLEQGTMHFVVDGGDDQEIANTIFSKLVPGTWLEGSTTVMADVDCGWGEVRFSRPEDT